MHILFIGRSVYHYTYYDSIIRALYAHGHKITLRFDEEWSKNQSDAALQAAQKDMPGLTAGWTVRRAAGLKRNIIFSIRELRTVGSYLRRPEQSVFYLQRWINYLPVGARPWVGKRWVRAVLRQHWIDPCFRAFERLVPPVDGILRQIKEINPDVIIASPVNMRYSEEVEYVKAARKLGVLTALPVLSWDNLTTKGLIQVLPDLIMAWNHAHAAEAVSVHGARGEQVVEIGSPFFDKWTQSGLTTDSREEYCRKVGLDPARPYVLYMGSSRNIAPDETWLVEQTREALLKHPDPRVQSMQLLVRPHPANAANYARFDGTPGLSVWPRGGELPESESGQQDMFNAVKHAVASFGINTSAMLDAIVMGCPVISALIPQYQKTQEQSNHFQHLLKARSIHTLWSPDQLGDALVEILDGKDRFAPARRQFVIDFVSPYGPEVSAGEAAAAAVELLAAGTPKNTLAKAMRDQLSGKASQKEKHVA